MYNLPSDFELSPSERLNYVDYHIYSLEDDFLQKNIFMLNYYFIKYGSSINFHHNLSLIKTNTMVNFKKSSRKKYGTRSTSL